MQCNLKGGQTGNIQMIFVVHILDEIFNQFDKGLT